MVCPLFIIYFCVVGYDMSPNYHTFLCWCLWYVHCLSSIFVLLFMTCLLIIIHFCAGGYGMSTVVPQSVLSFIERIDPVQGCFVR